MAMVVVVEIEEIVARVMDVCTIGVGAAMVVEGARVVVVDVCAVVVGIVGA